MSLALDFARGFFEKEPTTRAAGNPETTRAWTEHITKTVSAVIADMGYFVASKWSKDGFNRSEYMNLDAIGMEHGTQPYQIRKKRVEFPMPSITVEIESDPNKNLYDYWKLLCVRSRLRVLFIHLRCEADRHVALNVLGQLRQQHHAVVEGDDLLFVGEFGMAKQHGSRYEPCIWRGGAFVPLSAFEMAP